MLNVPQDQAAGLRRIMAAPAPRIISIISAAATQDKSRLMTNLAASISDQGNKTLVIHASKESSETYYGINALPTLVDTAGKKMGLNKAIHLSQHGFSIAKMMQKSQLDQMLNHTMSEYLTQVFHTLADQYEILLVDASLNKAHLLPISLLNDGEIIIQLTRQPESIKDAYAMIKKVYSQLGRRHFGIIVDDATEQQAKVVFNNISSVAKRYMRIDLEYFGAIPKDDHISKASQLGRSVIDAFPLATASNAFKKMALKLDYKHATPADFTPAQFA
ncbi:MinD/ParA family ATP-binding protein [Methylotenera sp. N17]|jgi:flagellar biosynthesis protein FlhG|uniref:MinD/ParA family ATP-binding protein n=1 Tax=Methylotenera sp. N17 TaxID=1502761 RepID=UPI0006491F6E|nr:MotR [Methylotenera sp. N17]